VKYAWITRHRDLYPIVLLCEALDVSKAGYYDSLCDRHSKNVAPGALKL